MLPTEARLRHRGDFADVLRRSRRMTRGPLVLHILDPDRPPTDRSVGTPKVGFIISGKVGNAVARNRLRRRLRHVVRELLTQLPDGARLVVRALPGAAALSSAELTTLLGSAVLGRGASRSVNP